MKSGRRPDGRRAQAHDGPRRVKSRGTLWRAGAGHRRSARPGLQSDLTNLRLIDNVSDTLILRPLISHDKEHIIDLAREIGTEDFARTMPEYCGVISKSPTVKAVKAKIEAEEEHFDFSILDKVVEEASNIDIREIAQQTEETVVEVETVTGFGANDAILDIRSIDEQEDKPLKVEGLKLFPCRSTS